VEVTSFIKRPGASLAFDGGGFIVSGGTAVFNSGFAFGGAGAASPAFILENGAEAVVNSSWRMAPRAEDAASTIVTGTEGGARSRLQQSVGSAATDLVVGENGDGFLYVRNGGLVNLLDDFILGQHATSTGQASIDGVQDGFRAMVDVRGSAANSSVYIAGDVGGDAAQGELSVLNGGLVQTSGDVVMAGFNPGSQATLLVAAQASGFQAELDAEGNIFVGGTATAAGGTAEVMLNSGGRIRGGEMIVWGGGSVEMNGGQLLLDKLNLRAGTSNMIMAGGQTTVTDFNKAASATFSLQGGLFTISGGDAIFNSNFSFGGSNGPTVRIENGADAVITTSWRMALGGLHSAATIVVGTGNGRRSTLRGTQGGDTADLVVGENGSATLLVNAGGLVALRDDFVVGRNAGSLGVAVVTGVQDGFRSTVDVTGGGADSPVEIGGAEDAGAATGSLEIRDGGLLRTSADVYLARSPGALAQLTVGGMFGGFPAELDAGDDIFVGGTGSTAGGTASLLLNNGGVVRGDRMVVWGGGTVNMSGGDMFLNTLKLDSAPVGAFELGAGALHVDLIEGSIVNEGGTISPGDSPGQTQITGSYRHEPGAELFIELAGLEPVKEHDVLSVAGDVTLNEGTLRVALEDGFIPEIGDSFTVLESGALRGEFRRLIPPALAGVGWELSYGEEDVVFSVISLISTPGDYNGDNVIDAADYVVWRKLDGQMGENLAADGNGDDVVDKLDYDLWRTNFGSSVAAAGAHATSNASVPEPGVFPLLLLVLCCMLLRIRLASGTLHG
jgi:hypothetical protein